jgi:hypothetical protein
MNSFEAANKHFSERHILCVQIVTFGDSKRALLIVATLPKSLEERVKIQRWRCD